ncbi:MAG TPA: putative selenate ABC transporter substrate-binding protein [Roseiflexaceae bacterium]|nr:putative selenate ABC transporter substrate-binding protein [Roseiflexaceae bacterium]
MRRPFLSAFIVLALFGTLLVACGTGATATSTTARPLIISAIPDQAPEKLSQIYTKLATYLSTELGMPVEYKPLPDYKTSVTAFKAGEIDLVWYGGLTSVQARVQVPGAQALVQRDIDATFHSVFIANKALSIATLADLKGHSFTFGGETSTSGRLMPQFFLQQAGVRMTDFKGPAGFSGTHDKTIQLVADGTYDAGVLNQQIWDSRLAEGKVDRSKIDVFYTSPAFYDYNWVIHPDAATRYGAGFTDRVRAAFLKLDASVPAQKELLDLFGAKKFIATKNENYNQIEVVARDIGKLSP